MTCFPVTHLYVDDDSGPAEFLHQRRVTSRVADLADLPAAEADPEMLLQRGGGPLRLALR